MADPLRAHLARLLKWDEAHASFEKAVSGVPADLQGARAPGFEHSPWQLIEHIRIAQFDLLDFAVNSKYRHDLTWPNDYWPASPAPPDATAWDKSIAAFNRDRDAVIKLVLDETVDLAAPVPTGKPQQTILRSILLVADHNAYHVGQLVAVRRALGNWG